VPKVFETGELPPYYFIAMEFVRGRTCPMSSRAGLWDPAAVRIAHDLSEFLQAAHKFERPSTACPSGRCLHGDLKPG